MVNLSCNPFKVSTSLIAAVYEKDIASPFDSTLSRNERLVLTTRPWQRVPVGEMNGFETMFAKSNYSIEATFGEKPNSYELVFDDEQTALEAKAQSSSLEHNFIKYCDRRPGPDNHVVFKTLSPVQVRAGKSFKSRKVTMLTKDAIIVVNQQKGRRARVISLQDRDSLDWVSLNGWVSLYTETGIRLLNRLEYA